MVLKVTAARWNITPIITADIYSSAEAKCPEYSLHQQTNYIQYQNNSRELTLEHESSIPEPNLPKLAENKIKNNIEH
jgi:hypothetical protein